MVRHCGIVLMHRHGVVCVVRERAGNGDGKSNDKMVDFSHDYPPTLTMDWYQGSQIKCNAEKDTVQRIIHAAAVAELELHIL